jgi:hypothetical protein
MNALPDRLPLVIGVTGHRDLRDEDVPTLEREVAAIVVGLRRDYLRNDNETPIVVLSSLAEGADRLVARVALAHGARLIAPMPMPIEEYRRDFEPGLKPGNAAEFDALLAQAVTAPVVPFSPGNSIEAVRADSAKRNAQYRAVGLFIAQHSNVLIALWNGDGEAMAPGGTAEVVAFKRCGIPLTVNGSARASLDASEIGPVIHVVTPRQNASSAAEQVSVRQWGRAVIRRYRGALPQRLLHGVGTFVGNILGREIADVRDRLSDEERRELEGWETFEALTSLTRTFNRDAALLSVRDHAGRARNSSSALFAVATPAAIEPDTARELAMERAPRWCRMFAIADVLAQDWQSQFGRDWVYLYSFALLAFLCFVFFSNVDTLSNLLLVLYMLGFLGIFAVVARAHMAQHQGRFLDYRALAEALRVAAYWRIVGIGTAEPAAFSMLNARSGSVLVNAYPIKQPSELSWVKIALRVLELVEPGDRLAGGFGFDAAGHAVARHCWVRGQYGYFRSRSYRLKRSADAMTAHGLLLAASAPFVIVPIVLAFTSPAPGGVDSAARTLLLIASGLLPGIGSILNEYSERLALSARARQYDRMRMLFERACDLLPEELDESSAPLARAVYLELGQEAMRENADWVAIYRERPIQPPQ